LLVEALPTETITGARKRSIMVGINLSLDKVRESSVVVSKNAR
jgi:hypothetical protein